MWTLGGCRPSTPLEGEIVSDTRYLYDALKEDTLRVSNERAVPLPRAFAAWVVQYAHKLDLDDALDQTALSDIAPDLGVNGWFRDEDEGEFHLWRCEWTDDAEKSFGEDSGKQLLQGLERLLAKPTKAKTATAKHEAAKALGAAVDHEYNLVLNIAAPTSFGVKVERDVGVAVAKLARKLGVDTYLRLWDGQSFENLKLERKEIQESLKGEKVDFPLNDGVLVQLGTPTVPAGWKVALANLSGSGLAEVANRFGSRLFHLNVRFALPLQKRIKNIRKTLSSPDEAKFFWLYNNGLTILCDDFTPGKGKPPSVVTIENPQVVNGCQTVSAFAANEE